MIFSYLLNMQSHPSWVCGLKLDGEIGHDSLFKSHPSWVCGLKLKYLYVTICPKCHTLRGCVDWNKKLAMQITRLCRHTLRGCVDWNSYGKLWMMSLSCHTLRGCVDWNHYKNLLFVEKYSHTHRGCVDWNNCWMMLRFPRFGHTLRGCVDWNLNTNRLYVLVKQSHPSWVCGLKQFLVRDYHINP